MMPIFSGGGGGTLKHLGAFEAAADSELDIEDIWSTAYDHYVLDGWFLASTAAIRVRTDQDGDSTYDTGASDYDYRYNHATTVANQAYIEIAASADYSLDLTRLLMNVFVGSASERPKLDSLIIAYTTGIVSRAVQGARDNQGILTGLRIYPSIGTITAHLDAYGVKK